MLLAPVSARVVAAGLCIACARVAPGQVGPDGIDWVTIGAPGNAPWAGDGTPGDRAVGRGRVDYEYKIGKFEVTSAQWVEFFNAAYDRAPGDTIPHVIEPLAWGAQHVAPNNPGGQRWRVPAGREMWPVGEISWRTAAIFCNWLCNDKGTARSAFLNGAYDVSTFGYTGPFSNIFTDQLTHNPGAAYWIPTWDEWIKAAHYDPNKLNADGTRGGYWKYSNTTDLPLVGGPPGAIVNGVTAQANFGWSRLTYPGQNPYTVPLGSYPQTLSPWGLLDIAGEASEWTEGVLSDPNTGERFRRYEGSFFDSEPFYAIADRISDEAGDDYPSFPDLSFGLRVASVVPSPGSAVLLGLSALFLGRPRRGGSSCAFRESCRMC